MRMSLEEVFLQVTTEETPSESGVGGIRSEPDPAGSDPGLTPETPETEEVPRA